MNIAALRPVLCMPGCDSRSSSSTRACGASVYANEAPAMPAPTTAASNCTSVIGVVPQRAPLGARINVLLPNRLSIRSTASSAVLLRTSQRRVELHHVERRERAGVGDHLHAQLRLAVGGAARHRGVHARRDLGVEEVDVEAHVQVRVGHRSSPAPAPSPGACPSRRCSACRTPRGRSGALASSRRGRRCGCRSGGCASGSAPAPCRRSRSAPAGRGRTGRPPACRGCCRSV